MGYEILTANGLLLRFTLLHKFPNLEDACLIALGVPCSAYTVAAVAR